MEILKTLPDAHRWHCSKCGKWNDVEKEVCPKCKSTMTDWADMFRVKNKLTPEEINYYGHQVPIIIRELREIKILLGDRK